MMARDIKHFEIFIGHLYFISLESYLLNPWAYVLIIWFLVFNFWVLYSFQTLISCQT